MEITRHGCRVAAVRAGAGNPVLLGATEFSWGEISGQDETDRIGDMVPRLSEFVRKHRLRGAA
ncbi:MAG: hypothetical protein K6T31_11080, partial [Alicyclobacillus sp.]|nr:hypothetical protein [Alicyclobacillus sp.]